MTPLRRRMLEDMQLRGLAPRTQESYLAAGEQLAVHYDRSPDLITEEELRHSFLYLRNAKHLAPNTANVALSAVKFLYTYTLQRPWPLRDLIRPPLPQKLPVVLSVEEVWQLLGQIRLAHERACLSVISACGLRLLSGVQLQVAQIDSARMQLHIRGGKGTKDRAVPLPPRTLTLLRAHWLTHRNSTWLFPSPGPTGVERATATVPMDARGLQKAFRRAVQEVGLNKPASVHSLRHSWATHLLESGVRARLIQLSLGHTSPTTTAISTHLTRKGEQVASDALDLLTAGMPLSRSATSSASMARLIAPSLASACCRASTRRCKLLTQCRTETLGGHIYTCPSGATTRYSYHSCRNRHCPTCQHAAAQTWLARQQELLLPLPYFLVTFTLPSELRDIAYRHQRTIYTLLFRASAAALMELARDPRFLGAQIGLVGVLQTWTREMRYHPHVQYLVPGGGLADDGRSWMTTKADFLVHVKPLAALFRAKLRAALRQSALWTEIPATVWQQPWVVDCRPVGTARAALRYLAPYSFRVALSNKGIVRVADDQVTFRSTVSATGQTAVLHPPRPGVHRSFPAACVAQGLRQGALLWLVPGWHSPQPGTHPQPTAGAPAYRRASNPPASHRRERYRAGVGLSEVWTAAAVGARSAPTQSRTTHMRRSSPEAALGHAVVPCGAASHPTRGSACRADVPTTTPACASGCVHPRARAGERCIRSGARPATTHELADPTADHW